jgi:hypothetical protein
MKRSEMLDLMADTYIKFTTNSYTTRDRMVLVLKEMEKAGMLPPETIRYIDQDNGNTLVSSECLWEPEDE